MPRKRGKRDGRPSARRGRSRPTTPSQSSTGQAWDEEPCPDFALAPLETFPPDVFDRDGANELHAFMLSLALAYNDLKDIEWMVQQLGKFKLAGPLVSPERGQMAGMRIYSNRVIFGILNEILQAIKTHAELVEGNEISGCVRRSPINVRRSWSALVSAANDKASDGLSTFLVKVRNNVVSHYYQPKTLLKAYQGYFFGRPADEYNKAAYASFGENMEGTRFYFVDGPLDWYYRQMLAPGLFEETSRYLHHVNNALRGIIEEFLRWRVEELHSTKGDTHDTPS